MNKGPSPGLQGIIRAGFPNCQHKKRYLGSNGLYWYCGTCQLIGPPPDDTTRPAPRTRRP